MAVQTFEKEYHVDTAAETIGYDALTADMRSWYDWDEIDSKTDEKSTLFKKFQPGSTEKWAGIRVNRSTGNYGLTLEILAYNGASQYTKVNIFGQNHYTLRYAAAVVTDKGFFIMASDAPMPFFNTQYFFSVGIYKSTDRTTGTAGVCTITLSGERVTCILGDGTTSANDSSTAVSPLQSYNGFVASIPLIYSHTKDVPDDILQLVYKPDNYTCCLQNISIDGKKYVRLGDILIPE